MEPIRFSAQLIRPEGTGTWTFVDLPGEFSAGSGKKGQVRVKGSVNGIDFRSTALPHGDGRHYLVVAQTIRKAARVGPGDCVEVVVEIDDGPREVEVPEDLRQALVANPSAQAAFARYSYSHQKEIVDWINEAKRPETRERRIGKAIESLD